MPDLTVIVHRTLKNRRVVLALVDGFTAIILTLLWLYTQEPDTYGVKWEQTNVPGLQSIYLNLLPVLYRINQGVVFMVQGTGQAALVNWGDGFVTDTALISQLGMSNPNGFFQGIMTAEYLNQVWSAVLTGQYGRHAVLG